MMDIISDPKAVQAKSKAWKLDGRVGFVPTMGCLHEGHLALVRRAKELADRVIVSIFVNPLQFGKNEDLDSYPRTLETDIEKLSALGVDLLFAPRKESLYPEGFSTNVQVGALAKYLEGASRPGHFDGMATVCLKLFEIVQADMAVFGEKDFQQLAIIRRMVTDFDLPLEIISHATVREQDGRAMSSRNCKLSESQRNSAVAIPRALFSAAENSRPDTDVGSLRTAVIASLQEAGLEIDYVEVADADILKPCEDLINLGAIQSPQLLIAARLGATRLIDNVRLLGDQA